MAKGGEEEGDGTLDRSARQTRKFLGQEPVAISVAIARGGCYILIKAVELYVLMVLGDFPVNIFAYKWIHRMHLW